MGDAHRILAYGSAAMLVAGLAWSSLVAFQRAPGGRIFKRFEWAVVALLALTSGVGVLLYASGSRPREDLHLVYGVLAIGLLPLARSFFGGKPRRDAWLGAAAYLVAGVVVYRLFSTG